MRRALNRRAVRTVAGGLIALSTLMLAACGPAVESAFSKCADTAYQQALRGSKSALPPDLAKLYEKSARERADKQCSLIRDECKRDAQSADCQRLIQQYGG